MKKAIFVMALMLVASLGLGSAADTESMIVKVDLLESKTSISIPSQIDLGQATKGYISEETRMSILNVGTNDIEVTITLNNSADDIFQNLGFKKILADESVNINTFDLVLEKPSQIGGERDQSLYVQLDLRDYNEEVEEFDDYSNIVIFTAMSIN